MPIRDGHTETSRSGAGFRPGRAGRFLPVILLAALLGGPVLLPGCGGGQESEPGPDTTVAAADTAATGRSLLDARIAGNPTDRKMANLLGAAAFADDPHTFKCSVCHPRFVQKTTREWRNTCYQSGCHPHAWDRTVMHNIDVGIFNNCLNCHHPHTWRANAKDCLSCHGDIHTARGTVPATQVSGVQTFSHALHADLPCARCHRSETRHATLLVTEAAQCQACHHGPPAVAACESCHGGKTLDFTRTETVPLVFNAGGGSRTGELPFDHGLHKDLACQNCHVPSAVETPRADCASCHDAHHAAGARCITCHRPPPAGVHDLAVHADGCTACHGGRSFPKMRYTRNFCEVCHQDRVDHLAGRNCVTCHKLTPDQDGGGR